MPAIEIRTTQNVVIEYELAALRERFFAFFFDLVIFYVAYFIGIYLIFSAVGDYIDDWGWHFLALMQAFGLIFFQLFFEVMFNGQTPGKKAMGIRVVRLDGREPGLGDYLMRNLFLLVDFALSLGVLAALMIGSSDKSQRLGDLAANTSVIRLKSKLHFHLNDILKIQTLDNYQPRFPTVRNLSESDMLLIKNLLSRYNTWHNDAHNDAIREATQRLCQKLNIELPGGYNQVEFLKTLIRDYIVLTR